MSGERKIKNEIDVWIDAINATRRQLEDHCTDSKPDKLRFQNERVRENLLKRIEAAAGERQVIDSLYWAYWEMTINYPSRHFPLPSHYQQYHQPLRLHCEELKARGKDDPDSFCGFWLTKDRQVTRDELFFRVGSLASWIEAQESFLQWFALKAVPVAWRGNPDGRRGAFQASILADLITDPGGYWADDQPGEFRRVHPWEGSGIGTNEKGAPWSQRQWANILKDAARIAEKQIRITPLEMWVWWCYPIFFRYEWSTRQVQEAASEKNFTDKDSRELVEKSEQDFRRHWISCGLRFRGRKTKRTNPPLAQFVTHVSM